MKKNFFLFALIFSFTSYGQTADEFISSAKLKLENNDIAGAELDFNLAIEQEPGNSNAYYERGVFRYNWKTDFRGNYKRVRDDFDRSIELDSNNYNAYLWRGNLKRFKSDINGAYEDINRAFLVDSSNFQSYLYRSKTHNQNGLRKRALEDLERAMKFPLTGQQKSAYGNYFNEILILKSRIYHESKFIIGKDAETMDSLKIIQDSISSIASRIPEQNWKESGIYYPYTHLTEKDKLKYPIEVAITIDVKDIYNLSLSNDQFFLGFEYGLFSPINPNYVSQEGDSLKRITDLTNFVEVDYVMSAETKEKKMEYVGVFGSGYQYDGSIESSFYHNWRLKDYPFDKQDIQIRFTANVDSSIFKFKESLKYPAQWSEKILGLGEGYEIQEIKFHKEFVRGEGDWFSPSIAGNATYPVGVFDLVVSRAGSGLIIKLFLGSFLSYIISWLVFIIPKRSFDARIELSVGAIFGAIGNKYFVESTTPAMQVLTKADIINNLVIMMVLLNIVLIILQKNNKINIGRFENSNFALTFSASLMVFLTFITIII